MKRFYPKNSASLLPFVAMIRRHWMPMALGSLLALLATLAAVGLLSLSGWFLAAAAYAGLETAAAKAFNFFIPSIGVRLFAITRTAARYGERIVCHDATFRILETLRVWCFRKIEPLAPARLEGHHSGDLLSRMSTDIDTLDNLYLRVLSPTLVAAVASALILGFMALFHPLIALVDAVLLAMAGVGIPILSHHLAGADARKLNEQTAHLRTALVDGIHGLSALLTCDAGPRYLDRIERLHGELVQSQSRMSAIEGFSGALTNLASGLAMVCTLAIGANAVSAGSISGPILALLILTAMASFDAVAALPTAYQYLGRTRKAAGRLHSIAGTRPAVLFPDRSSRIMTSHSLRFEHVYFKYPQADQTTLKDIDWSIDPNSRMAVMGPTGAGKSTLLHLLARFEDPDRGSIQLGGVPLAEFCEADLRRNVCIIDQRAHIFNGTLRDNLLLAKLGAEEKELQRVLSAVQLEDFVDGLPDGMDTWVGEAGRLLSGGQAKRLSIARAVLSDAPIWVLDEPTEGLDRATADGMMANLMSLSAGRTTIMITHRSEAIWQMDQIALMDKGELIAADTPQHLYRRNALFRSLVKHAPKGYV